MTPVSLDAFASLLVAFLLSLVGCEVLRRLAIRRSLLDHANERSLHSTPTPRLGGVAVVIASLVTAVPTSTSAARAFMVVGVGIALLGLLDDLRPMSAGVRFVLHIVGALAMLWVFDFPVILIGRGIRLPGSATVSTALLVTWVVGTLNIFNFMDGMDGLAGSQTVATALTFGMLGAPGALTTLMLMVASATLGFLAHNAPPARIFMGDAGSTFLGLVFSAAAVSRMSEGFAITSSALALAPFLLDGTFTIVRRMLNRERFWTAHRSHLYQRAVQAGLSHRSVLLVYCAWMAVSALTCALSSLGTFWIAFGWLVAIANLLAILRWVSNLEKRSRPSEISPRDVSTRSGPSATESN